MVKKSARCTRRTHSPAFKARVALSALREDKTKAMIDRDHALPITRQAELLGISRGAVC